MSRTGSQQRGLAAISLTLMLIATGCSDRETGPPATTTTAPVGPVDLPYNPDPPGDARMIGTLVGDPGLDGGCLWLRQGVVDLSVLWPPGFAAEFNPVRLIDADGRVVAEEGDEVDLTGSFAADPASYRPHRCVVGSELWLAGGVGIDGRP